MEAATIPAGAPAASDRLRKIISTYGLIGLLLAMPVIFAIHDLVKVHSLSRLGDNLLSGVSNGAIWALVAIGYTLVYGIVELINFAHGEVFMLGSFVSAGFFGTLGLTAATGLPGLVVGLLATLIVAMVALGVLNVMIERVAYRPLRNAPKLAPLITAVGFSFILQNVGLLWLGGSPAGVPDLIHAQQLVTTVFGITIENADVLSIGVTVPLLFVMTTFISKSRLGKAM